MRIYITGAETQNKGAELMLYAILQEIERRYPDAVVRYPVFGIEQPISYIKTSLNFNKRLNFPFFLRVAKRLHLTAWCHEKRNPFFNNFYPPKDIDIVLDAGGYQFGDRWNWNEQRIDFFENYLESLHKQGTKIVYLPQAYGPFDEDSSQRCVMLLSKYADAIYAREKKSYDFLVKAGCELSNLFVSTDFTSLVEGTVSDKYNMLKGAVAVIPNIRMTDKGGLTKPFYIDYMADLITACQKENRKVFLLNHEGKDDEYIAERINNYLDHPVPLLTGLNALEVKGVIAQSSFVISSRFHGVANALNSCVPCLATSWSYKYELLFADYGLDDCLLSLENRKTALMKLHQYLQTDFSALIHQKLNKRKPQIVQSTKEMWNQVWSLLK